MKPIDLGRATRPAITTISSKFMLDGPTYVRGAALGFEGADFYVAGRGGALGDVAADVVAAAMVFFEPGLVRAAWERTAPIMSRADAAAAFADCAHVWAREHFDDEDLAVAGTVVELGAKVVAGTSPAGAPLFAAWRALPTPTDTLAAAVHTLNALRELRAAYHGGAVLAAGLSVPEAMAVSSPAMAPLFGWNDPLPPAAPFQAQWDTAEAGTDLAIGLALAILTDSDQEAFVSACAALHAGIG